MKRAIAAFSLVELSIVLVILGLLTGGILAGQSMIKASELRAVSTEFNKYATAGSAFRDKYMALPGDMANATSFWGAQNATPATCSTTASTTALTCNGNGNSVIAFAMNISDEQARAWQHLANAGLIEGTYAGTWVNADRYSPKSKFGGTNYWNVGTYGATSGDTANFAFPDQGHSYFIADTSNTYLFKPEEAWNLDAKMDDGKPATGRVLANKGDSTYRCTDRYGQAVAAADQAANYSLSVTAVSCYLSFAKAF